MVFSWIRILLVGSVDGLSGDVCDDQLRGLFWPRSCALLRFESLRFSWGQVSCGLPVFRGFSLLEALDESNPR